MTFRFAEEKDCGLILDLIRGLAEYEKMADRVVATEDLLREWIFEKKAEVLFVCEDGKEACFALFFHSFSTFLGRAGITKERGCGPLEWACLDWNKPSIDFYLSLGAEPLEDWTTYRLTGKELEDLAGWPR